ncbi:MFS transporter, partial [Planomonospora corallina]
VFTLWTAVAVALAAAFAQGLGKLALDAIVQREIGEEVRSSTFGVVEAFLQVAWVVGGLVGLLLSLFARGPGGLATMAAVLAGSLGWLLLRRRRRLEARDARARAARAAAHAQAPPPASSPASSPSPATATVAGAGDAPESPESAESPASRKPEKAARRRRRRPAGTTTAVIPHDDAPTEKHTKPLTNPHG